MDFWTDNWSGRRVANAIYVIAGSERETAAGLLWARRIWSKTGRPIVLLVAHLVPYGVDIDGCGHNLEQIGAGYLPLAEAAGADVEVRVCACREPRHLFARMLLDVAMVVVPGRRGRWWRSASERLARRLECEGHRVTFVDVDQAPDHAETDPPVNARRSFRVVSRQPASRRA